MAPVAAASNSLFSTLNDRDTRGSSPPYLRTRSRVSSSSAHWKQVQALLSHSSSVWCARDRYGFKSLLVTENSRLYLGLNAFSSSFLSNEKNYETTTLVWYWKLILNCNETEKERELSSHSLTSFQRCDVYTLFEIKLSRRWSDFYVPG